MDKSVDSIGSCSLDVDADSTDFSDTSGSLNLITPSSAKDITKEFTSRIKERCEISQTTTTLQQTTTFLDPISGKINTIITPTTATAELVSPVKKPSYLNLACCVNGYSNLTTYDSKLRQNINKSREVSPIRPSANTVQYCKGVNNLLAPPTYKYSGNCSSNNSSDSKNIKNNSTKMETGNNKWSPKAATTTVFSENTNSDSNGFDTTDDHSNLGPYLKVKNLKSTTVTTGNKETNGQSSKSFIQQRVERLYGTEAIAKGFYSPKKTVRTTTNQENVLYCERFATTKTTSSIESNGHGGNEIKIKNDSSKYGGMKIDDTQNFGNTDLPVFRHLRPEFRAQLPTISPKKTARDDQKNLNGNLDVKTTKSNHELHSFNNYNKVYSSVTSPIKNTILPEITSDNEIFLNNNNHNNNNTDNLSDLKIMSDVIRSVSDTIIKPVPKVVPVAKVVAVDSTEELLKSIEYDIRHGILDGHHFIKLLKVQQARLLILASAAEAELELLSDNAAISEDILGYLRSAAGKARLLVTQKMKQFEGLCIKNLNPEEGEKFPTTIADLQGFWDMVNLQIDHIDSIFKEMDILKANNWKRTEDTGRAAPSGAKLTRRPLTSNPKATIETNGGTTGHAKKSNNSALAAEKREAQRKQLLEFKRKNKVAMAAKMENKDSCAGDVLLNDISTS